MEVKKEKDRHRYCRHGELEYDYFQDIIFNEHSFLHICHKGKKKTEKERERGKKPSSFFYYHLG